MTEAVPIEKCTTLARYEVRMEYDVDELAESILRFGQIQPAKGYREGDSVVVFVGLRRLKAVQKSYEEYGEPKTFLVDIVDPKPSEETITSLIVEENERRSNLSGVDYVKMYTTLDPNIVEKTLSEKKRAQLRKITSSLVASQNQDVLADWHFVEKLTGKQLSISRIEELVSLAQDRYELVVGAYAVLIYPIPSPIRDEGRVRAFLHESISLPPELRGYLKARRIEEYAVTEITPLDSAKVAGARPSDKRPVEQPVPVREPEPPRRAPEQMPVSKPEASAPPVEPTPEKSFEAPKPEPSARPMSETEQAPTPEVIHETAASEATTPEVEPEAPKPAQPSPAEEGAEEEPTVVLVRHGEADREFRCPHCGHKFRVVEVE